MKEHAIRRILGVLFNPVSFVALLGPLIMGYNLLYMRTRIIDPDSPLAKLIDDPLFRAALDYRTQLFTVILALVYYFYDNVRNYYHFAGDSPLNGFLTVISSDKLISINFVFIIIFLVLVVYSGLSGVAGEPSIVEYYIRPAGPLEIGEFPPMSSPLTSMRGFIILAGFASSLAFSKLR